MDKTPCKASEGRRPPRHHRFRLLDFSENDVQKVDEGKGDDKAVWTSHSGIPKGTSAGSISRTASDSPIHPAIEAGGILNWVAEKWASRLASALFRHPGPPVFLFR